MFKFAPRVILREGFHVVLKATLNSLQPFMVRAGVRTDTRTRTGTSHHAALWVLSVHNMAAIILLASSGGLEREREREEEGGRRE